MEYLLEHLNLFKVLFGASVLCTVMFTEIVKRLDKKDILKGSKVWLPLLFSCGFSVALKFVMKIDWAFMIFVEGTLFGFSVLGYEVVLKSVNSLIEKFSNKVDKAAEKSSEN